MAEEPKKPRPITDIDEVGDRASDSVEHCRIEVTEQDLPNNLPKTFMNLPVVQQRKFDDATAARFLAYYAATGRKGDSAVAAGVTYSTVRHWEVNDDTFAGRVLDAHEMWLNILEREAFRRGVEGVLEPVVAGKDPEIVTYIRKYDSGLLLALMKKADPTGYGNRDASVSVNVNTGVLRVPTPTTIDATALPVEEVED